jgi:uncharacterized protein YcbK (DUF882 family)
MGMALALAGRAELSLASTQDLKLTLSNTHTGEQASACFWSGGEFQQNELACLDRIMRDHRNNQQIAIDPQLYKLMARLQQHFGKQKPLEIVCGYRSPETNAWLRKHTTGVAAHSLHIVGKAVDIRIAGVPTQTLQQAALAMHNGGVGYYPKSRFVHVDTGKIRHWSGA